MKTLNELALEIKNRTPKFNLIYELDELEHGTLTQRVMGLNAMKALLSVKDDIDSSTMLDVNVKAKYSNPWDVVILSRQVFFRLLKYSYAIAGRDYLNHYGLLERDAVDYYITTRGDMGIRLSDTEEEYISPSFGNLPSQLVERLIELNGIQFTE